MNTTTYTKKNEPLVDLLVIGGGINGAGIALDAAGRGLKVHLVEQNDFASATSSKSSKLIHGGLRYLEYYEFRLVREALAEREVLLRNAPHLIKPMRFVLPHRPHLRPAWLIRIGLFLYDRLGGQSSLPKSNPVYLGGCDPIKSHITRGFEYTDCWVDDARLVISNLIALREKGGKAENYTRCESAIIKEGIWHVTLTKTHAKLNQPVTNTHRTIQARCLVNATGPWAQSFIETQLENTPSPQCIRLVKGSHLIVPRVYPGDQCYILQNEDKRIVFVIPYLNHFTIIGTTDKAHQFAPESVSIDPDEIDYLIAVFNDYFKKTLSHKDIVATYSGVRPLCADEYAITSKNPSAITRDYTLELQRLEQNAPILSVFGGKLTTYRRLAESAMQRLAPLFPAMGEPWTRWATLPGGDQKRDTVRREIAERCPFVPEITQERWCESYGTRYRRIINGAQSWRQLGTDLGSGLTEAEIEYLREYEWAQSAEDILYRRTKLYLTGSSALPDTLTQYLAQNSEV